MLNVDCIRHIAVGIHRYNPLEVLSSMQGPDVLSECFRDESAGHVVMAFLGMRLDLDAIMPPSYFPARVSPTRKI